MSNTYKRRKLSSKVVSSLSNEIQYQEESTYDLEVSYSTEICSAMNSNDVIADAANPDLEISGIVSPECHIDHDTEEDTPKSQAELIGIKLLKWQKQHIVSRSTMEDLLKILEEAEIEAPRSVYMLNKLDKVTDSNSATLKELNKGHFAYFGLKSNVEYAVKNKLFDMSSLEQGGVCMLSLKLNLDGLPLFNSSRYSLWPILCQFSSINTIFPVALYAGVTKPDAKDLLPDLCQELKLMCSEGFESNGYTFKTTTEQIIFCCDTPARSMIQGISAHNAFTGCGYCRCQGSHVSNRMTFPISVAHARTDEAYSQLKESNQLSLSPLEFLGLRSSFPPDYMHLVCLGICRKLFNYYFSGVKGRCLPCRLSTAQVQLASNVMLELAKATPSEFQRKPRAFSELSHFKATEFRSLVLYFGIIVLKKVLPKRYYQHFLLLHFAIYVFVCPSLSYLYDVASQCLKKFVHEIPQLFGEEAMVYNAHCLLHIAEYAKELGPLDRWSCFPFESFLSSLKRHIRPTQHIWSHVMNQVKTCLDNSLSYENNEVNFSAMFPNNCAFLADGTALLVKHVQEKHVSGHQLTFLSNFYDFPYSSSQLSIGIYKQGKKVVSGPAVRKAICIHHGSDFLIIPFA